VTDERFLRALHDFGETARRLADWAALGDAGDVEVEAALRELEGLRPLPDGRELTIQRIGPGQGRLCVGPRPKRGYYDDAFDYPCVELARVAMARWDGRGDAPVGWVRNFTTERRRPDGDPAREYRRA
jgi:hypothetical protein